MHKILFSLFDDKIVIYTYSVCIAVGLILTAFLFRFLSKKLGMSQKGYDFYSFTALLAVIVGFISAFVFQDFYQLLDKGYSNIYNAFKNLFQGKGFSLSGGITFMGGLIGGAGFFIIATLLNKDKEIKAEFPLVSDIAAPCILLAHGFGRIGCWFGGCCYGKETTSIFGVDYPVKNNVWAKVYPTQLYEAAFCFVAFAIFMLLIFKIKKRGLLIGFYAGAYSVFRFMNEFLRGDYRGGANIGISPSQVQSIVLFCVAVAYFLFKFLYEKKFYSNDDNQKHAAIENNVENDSGDKQQN